MSLARFDTRVEHWINSTAWLLPALYILSPKIEIVGPSFRLGDVLALALIAGHVWLSVRRREWSIGWMDWMYAALFASAIASTVWGYAALDIAPNIRDLFELPKILIFYLIYRVARSVPWEKRDIRKVGVSILVSLVPVFVLSVCQYVDVPGVNDYISPLFASPWHVMKILTIGRAVGTFGNPNYLAFFLIAPALIMYAGTVRVLMARPVDRPRLAWTLLSLGLLGVVFGLASSRTALVAIGSAVLACAVPVFWAARSKGSQWQSRVSILSLIVFGAVLAMGISTARYLPSPANTLGLMERFEVGYDEMLNASGDSETNFGQRLERWGLALDEIAESPVLGRGPAKELVEQLDMQPTDNEYLYHAARYGLVGLALYIALYAGMLRFAWRTISGAMVESLVGERTIGLVMFGMIFAAILFGIMAGTFYNLQIWPMMMFGYGTLVAYAERWSARGAGAESDDGGAIAT